MTTLATVGATCRLPKLHRLPGAADSLSEPAPATETTAVPWGRMERWGEGGRIVSQPDCIGPGQSRCVICGGEYGEHFGFCGSTASDVNIWPHIITLESLKEVAEAGQKIADEHHRNMAQNFLIAGITLIPSDELRDDQFIVSRAIYNAASKIGKPKEST